MDWHLIVPGENAFSPADFQAAYEVRLRCGKPMQVIGPFGRKEGTLSLSPQQLHLAAQALCGHQLARHEKALTEGFVPLPGGHRMGVCGEMKEGNILCYSALCVRMAHEVKQAAKGIFPMVYQKNVLIIGPPGSGKTTLLRDLVRRTARDIPVALIDSRGEIAACFQGVPQLDVGPMCDVMTGGEKGKVMMTMLRSMNPRMMATDELGTPEDAAALAEMQRCGVGVMATCHAHSLEDAKTRPSLASLFQHRLFSYAILLEAPGIPPRVVTL